MATLVLSAAGNALFPGIGGFVGAVVGGLIDNFLIMPALFPQKDLSGSKAQDMPVMSAYEGSPINFFTGPMNRVPGTVIWRSDYIPVKTSTDVGKGGGGQTVNSTSWYVDIAISFGDARYVSINKIRKLFANSKVIWDGTTQNDRFESITFYDGSQTTADPLMESYKGVGNVPVYKKTAFVVIKKLALSDFGNAVPNIQAWCEQDPDMMLRENLDILMDRAGYEESEYDTSRIDSCFKGMNISGPQATADALKALKLAYAFVMQEGPLGEIIFLPSTKETEITVDTTDMAAREEGTAPAKRRWSVSDRNDYSIPNESVTTFVNSDGDLQQGAVRTFRQRGVGLSTVTANLPLTLSRAEADAVNKRILWAVAAERQKVSLSLPPKFVTLQEGHVLTWTDNGVSYRMFCSEVTRGHNYLVEVSGFFQQKQVYTQTGISLPGDDGTDTYDPPDLLFAAGDIPALLDSQVVGQKIGFVWMSATKETDAQWRGAALFADPNDNDEFVEAQRTVAEGVFGRLIQPPGPGSWLLWDDGNTIVVQVTSGGSLTSVSEDQCLSGSNRIALRTPSGKWEIIGFRDVTQIGTNRYSLSRLLRGLRGTEKLVGDHAPGQPFMLLKNDGSTNFLDTGLSGVGSDVEYKPVAIGGLVSEADSYNVPIAGETLRPFAPYDFQGTVNGSGDLVLTWLRRTKRFVSLFPPGGAPLSADELPETYELEIIYGGNFGDIKRTVTVTDAQTYTYAAADIATDGFTSGQNVRVRLYQISQVSGRGTPETGVFPI